MITSCLFDDAGSVCYSLQNMRAFFAAGRGSRRLFLLLSVAAGQVFGWTRGPGTGDKLAIPCQPGRFRPHASYLRKEARCRASAKKLPKGTPGKGFLWTPPETEGPRSLWHPGAARYRDFPSRALLRAFERSIVGGTTDLLDPTRRKANFLWKFLCAGSAAADCGGDPIPTAVPPARIFAEQKSLRRRKTSKSAARQAQHKQFLPGGSTR